jgi:polyisoprenyl-phosphate glycosyltransferase
MENAPQAILLTPVFNDWESFGHLLREVDQALAGSGGTVAVVAVDDGSTVQPSGLGAVHPNLKRIAEVEVVRLARNLGHQKAIAVGLAYLAERRTLPVVVMDCDGEDRPSDLPRLLAEHACHPEQVVFARRARRSEGLPFRFFYGLYRLFFRVLTGKSIAFGNFSLVPPSLLRRVVFLPEIWNHFAAGIMRSGIPRCDLPTDRGTRYTGRSSMNFISLVVHGLSAISVYLDIAAVRMIFLSLVVILMVVGGFGALLYIRFLTTLAIPGWATTVGIGLVMILFQALLLLIALSFLVLNARSSKLFIPAKDYEDYILETWKPGRA